MRRLGNGSQDSDGSIVPAKQDGQPSRCHRWKQWDEEFVSSARKGGEGAPFPPERAIK